MIYISFNPYLCMNAIDSIKTGTFKHIITIFLINYFNECWLFAGRFEFHPRFELHHFFDCGVFLGRPADLEKFVSYHFCPSFRDFTMFENDRQKLCFFPIGLQSVSTNILKRNCIICLFIISKNKRTKAMNLLELMVKQLIRIRASKLSPDSAAVDLSPKNKALVPDHSRYGLIEYASEQLL